MIVFNVKELAEYLNCSVSSVRSLVRGKQIPYFRIGSKLNFKKDAIDNWIHNQEIKNMQDESLYQTNVKPLQKVGDIS